MIKEIIDYFEFEGNKIEVKSIIDESNNKPVGSLDPSKVIKVIFGK